MSLTFCLRQYSTRLLADAASGVDPEYTTAVAAIKADQYAQAIKLLESYVARAPKDAYAENWLGYSYRKTGALDAAFMHYDKALKIDPKHRGAHEYLGEAYLMSGNVAKAEEHLQILDRLCWLPCTEYSMLKTAVTTYKTTHKIDASPKVGSAAKP